MRGMDLYTEMSAFKFDKRQSILNKKHRANTLEHRAVNKRFFPELGIKVMRRNSHSLEEV
jgi:hypothetical protein